MTWPHIHTIMTTIKLDSTNSLLYMENCLPPSAILDFAALLPSKPLLQPTLQMFGHRPKFFDTTYSTLSNTVPSKHYHQDILPDDLKLLSTNLKAIFDLYHPNTYNTHYNCNLAYYSPDLSNGGSRGKHQDNPTVPLQVVLIYSFGQPRDFAIYKDNHIVTKQRLGHNSLIAMIGPTFQKIYQHSLLPLKKDIVALDRYSFNTRFQY